MTGFIRLKAPFSTDFYLANKFNKKVGLKFFYSNPEVIGYLRVEFLLTSFFLFSKYFFQGEMSNSGQGLYLGTNSGKGNLLTESLDASNGYGIQGLVELLSTGMTMIDIIIVSTEFTKFLGQTGYASMDRL